MAKKNKTADPGPKKETFEGRKDAGDFKKARAAPGASAKGKAAKEGVKERKVSEAQETFGHDVQKSPQTAEEKSRKANQEFFDKHEQEDERNTEYASQREETRALRKHRQHDGRTRVKDSFIQSDGDFHDKAGFVEDAGAEVSGSKKLDKLEKKAEKAGNKTQRARKKLPQQKEYKLVRHFDEKTGKVTYELETRKVPKKPKHGNPATAATRRAMMEAQGFVHQKISENEKENAGVEGAHKTEQAGEAAIDYARRFKRDKYARRQNKVAALEKKQFKAETNFRYQKYLEENPEIKKKAFQKRLQKQRIKREYNMSNKTVGLVGMWDCVAFDEVAGITFKDKDGVQIMKDYMASGSFARGKEEKAATASMVFVGNINHDVSVLLKTSHLFEPFPEVMAYDTAFLDRMHAYIPGWEIPKYRPEHFTDDYGFITDYLSEFMREMRKESYGDSLDKFFHLGKNLNQRDTIAVRRLVDAFVKLIYPDGDFTKEDIAEILDVSLELRRRVKEQLKKIGGMEFYDVNFSYIDNDSFDEHFVGVPETGGGKIIPDGMCNPGHVYTISRGKNGIIGAFRLESQMLPGNGKFEKKGFSLDKDSKSAADTAYSYLKANGNAISQSISTTSRDYIIDYQDLQGIGMTKDVALPTLVAISSIALGKPCVAGLAIIGDITISGTVVKVEDLAAVLQVCVDSGAKKVLIPISSATDFGTVPADLLSAVQPIFYSTPEEAVFRALGVE